jgi:AcrR family transcriptional regulator
MGRPSTALISKEGAAKAALEIIDEEGLKALSLQGVAKRLGVKAPSLYYHFQNKSELLSSVARALLNETPPKISKRKNAGWKDAMLNLCISTRKSLMRHPNAAPLLLDIYPEHIMLRTYEYWVKQYEVPPAQKMVIMEGLEKMTFGAALIGASSRAQGVPPFPSSLDPELYPALAEAIKANRKNEDQLFADAIKRFLSTF